METFSGLLRRSCGAMKQEGTGDWTKHDCEGLRNVYCSFSTIRVNKSRRIRLAGRVVFIGR
jgi:uncharacterized protein YfaT (DUF1175 family)